MTKPPGKPLHLFSTKPTKKKKTVLFAPPHPDAFNGRQERRSAEEGLRGDLRRKTRKPKAPKVPKVPKVPGDPGSTGSPFESPVSKRLACAFVVAGSRFNTRPQTPCASKLGPALVLMASRLGGKKRRVLKVSAA